MNFEALCEKGGKIGGVRYCSPFSRNFPLLCDEGMLAEEERQAWKVIKQRMNLPPKVRNRNKLPRERGEQRTAKSLAQRPLANSANGIYLALNSSVSFPVSFVCMLELPSLSGY